MSVDFDQISLVDVTRNYGRRRAVSRVSFSARRGEIVGLLGPNGAGKSTLMGMVATLVSPSSGRVTVNAARAAVGAPRQTWRSRARTPPYPELSARVPRFLPRYGVGGDRVEALNPPVSDRADDDVSGYSRGMRQRLALERALLHGPRLVLLDEPFTGLDDRAVGIVADRLKRIASEGAIVILATHDLDLAEGLVTRVVLLRDGRLIADEVAGTGLRTRYRALVGGG